METRNITIALDKAKEWYNSGNDSLKEVALQAFKEEELKITFGDIKSFSFACKVLHLPTVNTTNMITNMYYISKASVAMSKVQIIRKALNLDKYLSLTDNSEDCNYIYYPCNPFIIKDSFKYKEEIKSEKVETIGKIKYKEEVYVVLGGETYAGSYAGLGGFYHGSDKGSGNAEVAFLGCATKEIAEHFGKYFGMLITEAKYGDLPDFEIIERKYN